jgi:23S rRNA pseudouridine1911/1915/1917 synthase
MPESPDTFQFIADRGDARSRLDRILVRRVKEVTRFSRNVAQQWIESGVVIVDGLPALRASTRVREGAEVIVRVPPSAVRRVRPAAEDTALDVLFEDDTILVVNKPAGVVVHPSYKQLSGTLLNAVLWRTRGDASIAPGIVTRLDKDTSGLVLVALNAQTHARLQRDAAAGTLRKRYLACVIASPPQREGRITLPIGRDPDDRRRMIVTDQGASSETRYEVLKTGSHGDITLVACTLVTGRTHQIRVHLAASGWPIAGDRVYGSPHPCIARQALHASAISFPHPVTREPLSFESPLPADMQRLIDAHGTI